MPRKTRKPIATLKEYHVSRVARSAQAKAKGAVAAARNGGPVEGPTEHRQALNDFEYAGVAFRVVPVIETLRRTGRLTQAEYDALAHYREQAHRAEDDMAQESPLSPARVMGGGSSSATSKLPVGVLLATPAIIETARLERELGSLFRLARAVAVEDLTLTRWCVQQGGGVEKRRHGKVVAIEPRNPGAVQLAAIELRFAARRIMA